MSDQKVTISTDVVLNPLSWFDLEFREGIVAGQDRDQYESLLRFICPLSAGRTREDLERRYFELAEASAPLSVVPAEPNIQDRIISPLHQARVSYVLGNFVGTIALCGSVAEMLAILIWVISEVSIAGKPIDDQTETKVFGRPFEKLGQERRVSVLFGMGLIGENPKLDFDR